MATIIKRFWLLALLGIVFLASCTQAPTARMTVEIQFDNCSTTWETRLYSDNKPILTSQQLHNYNGETESNIGCGINEIEYGFHTNDQEKVSKIEFDVNDGEEVTAFISLNPNRKSVQPFVMGDQVNFRQVSVKVINPSNQVIAEGSAK